MNIGKSLPVWAKNQSRLEIFEKTLKFPYKNLSGKLIFTHFLSHLPGPLGFYTPVQQKKIFWWGGARGWQSCLYPGLVLLLCWGSGAGYIPAVSQRINRHSSVLINTADVGS